MERLVSEPWTASPETIEAVCAGIIGELCRQGLTDGNWDYLEPHAYEVMERIRDGELRNLHVMEG